MDGLTKELAGVLAALDYAAVAVFAASGALAAARRKHDIITFAFFAAVTGVGGGTLRDLLIEADVFWVHKPAFILVCLAAALAVWLFGWGQVRDRMLLWLDALGMAAYSVVGALKAAALGLPPTTCVVMGVLTATFGGIVRDVLAGEPSVLMRRELYITCALIGAGLFVLLASVGVGATPAALAGFAAAFGVRAGAMIFKWRLPGFPGRTPPS